MHCKIYGLKLFCLTFFFSRTFSQVLITHKYFWENNECLHAGMNVIPKVNKCHTKSRGNISNWIELIKFRFSDGLNI